jgi:integrase
LRLHEITKARAEEYMRDRRRVETARSVSHREAFERRRGRGEVPRNTKAPAPQSLSPASVNREIACLRKLLSFAVDMGELEANPLSRIRLFREPPGRIPTIEPEDKRQLLSALPEWMRPIARLAMMTGCRQSEILALRWKHVDLSAGTLTVEDSKSGDARRVPLHPALADELRERRGLPDGWVVDMPERPHRNPKTGRPMEPTRSPTSISHAFRNAARKIGRPDLRFHDLRHVCGSDLLATGANLPEVAAMLGHRTLVMAKRYSHANPVRLASLVAAMPAPPEIAEARGHQDAPHQEEDP